MKSRTFADNRLDPDPPTAPFDNLFAKRKADSATRNLVTVQPFKRLKNSLVVFGGYTDTVIATADMPNGAFFCCKNPYVRSSRGAVTNRVRN